ncbi:MAG: prepilin peptidase [Chloroflexi bacterium]|nr:prepilin peptidase [Chloroflexota bacterium]
MLGLIAGGYLLARLLPRQALYLIYVAALVVVAYYDIRERRVPNVVSYPAILFALGAMWAAPDGWRSALLGAIVAAAVMLVPVIVYGAQRAGIGDVKLAIFIGLILGFTPALFWAALIAFAGAAIVGLVGVVLGKLTFKSALAFGPFMALGACLALLNITLVS